MVLIPTYIQRVGVGGEGEGEVAARLTALGQLGVDSRNVQRTAEVQESSLEPGT